MITENLCKPFSYLFHKWQPKGIFSYEKKILNHLTYVVILYALNNNANLKYFSYI